MQPTVRARFNSDSWRWGVLAIVIAGAAVGVWVNTKEPRTPDECWFPGLPRYPNATLAALRHDADSWYATLDTRDTSSQIEAYYLEKIPLMRNDEPRRAGDSRSWMATGQYPNSSMLLISISKIEASDSKWKLSEYLDPMTHILVSMQAPKPTHAEGWPFGPEHPAHIEWAASVGKAIGKVLVSREEPKE